MRPEQGTDIKHSGLGKGTNGSRWAGGPPGAALWVLAASLDPILGNSATNAIRRCHHPCP
jgi:hypothetical protein